jgi:hypothetical protein
LASRSRTTFEKRRKELARMEKQRDKAAKRQQRKLEKNAPADDQPDSADEIAADDLELSAQPPGDTLDG